MIADELVTAQSSQSPSAASVLYQPQVKLPYPTQSLLALFQAQVESKSGGSQFSSTVKQEASDFIRSLSESSPHVPTTALN